MRLEQPPWSGATTNTSKNCNECKATRGSHLSSTRHGLAAWAPDTALASVGAHYVGYTTITIETRNPKPQRRDECKFAQWTAQMVRWVLEFFHSLGAIKCCRFSVVL